MAIDDPQGPVLLCFDGSEGARWAIRHAGRLLGDGRPGAVVFVFQPPERSWGGLSWLTGQGIDAPVVSRPDAEDLLKEAVALAQAAGFAAQPLLVQAEHPTAATLVDVAEDRDVPVIVMGQRGLSGLKSTVLGSVSRDVANAFHRPVLLV